MTWNTLFNATYLKQEAEQYLCPNSPVNTNFFTWPKFLKHSVIGHCARLVHFMTQLVAVDPNGAQCLQVPGD